MVTLSTSKVIPSNSTHKGGCLTSPEAKNIALAYRLAGTVGKCARSASWKRDTQLDGVELSVPVLLSIATLSTSHLYLPLRYGREVLSAAWVLHETLRPLNEALASNGTTKHTSAVPGGAGETAKHAVATVSGAPDTGAPPRGAAVATGPPMAAVVSARGGGSRTLRSVVPLLPVLPVALLELQPTSTRTPLVASDLLAVR